MVIAVGNDRQFRACANVLGCAQWADDPRFATNPARVNHRDELYDAMCRQLRERGAEEWFTELTAAGVPSGPIHDISGAFALAERLGLQPVATAGNEPTVANPITLNRTPVSYRSAPPRLGDATVTDDGAVVTARGTDILELDGEL
jgi:crotonobetainyl-CoA:carnitine CoA-transferase CaiB-like acyl-CoA transferase